MVATNVSPENFWSETLEKAAIRLEIDFELEGWEAEVLEISKTSGLKDTCAVRRNVRIE